MKPLEGLGVASTVDKGVGNDNSIFQTAIVFSILCWREDNLARLFNVRGPGTCVDPASRFRVFWWIDVLIANAR